MGSGQRRSEFMGIGPCGLLHLCSQLGGLWPRAVYRPIRLFQVRFDTLDCRLFRLQPRRLQGFMQKRSQIRFDYFELSWHHRNVLREIVDYVPGRLNLIRGPAGDPKPGLRGARRRTEASPIGGMTKPTSLPTGTQGGSPGGWQRWSDYLPRLLDLLGGPAPN